MGAIPNKYPGFQDVEDEAARAKFERAWGVSLPPGGWLSQMFEAMDRGQLRTVYAIGENPCQSEADQHRAVRLIEGLDHLVVQDLFLTKTAQMADVVLPAAAAWCESEGTVTNSERRVQRVRKAIAPPGEAREDVAILCDLARRLGRDWGNPSAEEVWNELRTLSPMHAGMSYARLEAQGGLQWCAPAEPSGREVPPRAALGGAGPGAPGALLRGRLRAARRRARRAVPESLFDSDRPPPGLLQHRRADLGLQLAAAPRRVARPLARRREALRLGRGRARPRHLAARIDPGAGAHRREPAPGARLHDSTSPTTWRPTCSRSTPPIPSPARPSSRPPRSASSHRHATFQKLVERLI